MFVTELLVGRGKDTRAVTHISHPISNVSVEDGDRMSKVASGAGGGGGGGWDISLVLRRSKLNKAQESCEVKEVKEEVKLTPLASTANSPIFKVEINDVTLDQSSIIHEKGRGLEALRYLLQINMVMRSYIALGVAEKMTALIASYTSEREQFGRVIGTFQAVSHRAADCFIELECLRLVNQQASVNLNTNHDCENDALISKIWAGNACHKISYSAQHLHGGTGVDKDYVLWRYCLLAKECELINGSASQNIDRLGTNISSNQ